MTMLFVVAWVGIGAGGGLAAVAAGAPGWVIAIPVIGAVALASLLTASFERWWNGRVYLSAPEKEYVRDRNRADNE